MSDDTGLAFVALFDTLGASAVVLEAASFLDDRLVAAAAEGHVKSFLGVVVQLDQTVFAYSKPYTESYRKVCRALDLPGAVKNGKLVFHQGFVVSVGDCRDLVKPRNLDGSCRTASLLGYDDLALARNIGIFVVVLIPVEEDYDIRVLLDGSGIPQVRKHRPVVRPLLRISRKLRQNDYRTVELPCQQLQVSGDYGDLLCPRIQGPSLRIHELQVVYDNKVESLLGLESSAFALHLHDADAGCVVDEDLRARKHFESAVNIVPVEPLELSCLELL